MKLKFTVEIEVNEAEFSDVDAAAGYYEEMFDRLTEDGMATEVTVTLHDEK